MAALLVTTLGEFLDAAAAKPFAWGRQDCALFVADWIETQTGIDGGDDLRGRYASKGECARLLALLGGLVRVVGRRALRCGLTPTDAPDAGVIGVVTMLEDAEGGSAPKPALFAAICVAPGRWATRAPQGLVIGPATAVAAWTL